jgi:rare lipoprotein A
MAVACFCQSRTRGLLHREDGSATSQSAKPTNKPTVANNKGGAYFQKDGPADHIPVNLNLVPDAVPQTEPLIKSANQPYTAMGMSFRPDTSEKPFKATGVASWYGKQFQGRKTTSGERYDMFAMTAAHPTLPIPSYVRVTNAANGKSVIVRINDRGPFHRNRAMDLSYAAAYKLGFVKQAVPRSASSGYGPWPAAKLWPAITRISGARTIRSICNSVLSTSWPMPKHC